MGNSSSKKKDKKDKSSTDASAAASSSSSSASAPALTKAEKKKAEKPSKLLEQAANELRSSAANVVEIHRASASDVSLDPVDDAPKPTAASKQATAAAAGDDGALADEARDVSTSLRPPSKAEDAKKKRLSDNIANRLSMVESIISGADVTNSEKTLDDSIARIENDEPTLTELVLNNIVFFGKASKETRSLKQIQIADAVAKNTHLLSLVLTNNLLDDEFAVAISQALAQNKTLTMLNLESNHITGIGVQALANMLTANSTLRELKLNNQKHPISSEGEEALASALEVNESLLKLNLDIRDVTQREWIEKRLSSNLDRVRKQRYEQNKDSMVVQLTDLQRKIMSIVTDNFDEVELDLSNDMEFAKLKEEEKVALANGLANNTSIKTLKLIKVALRDAFAEAFGAALARNAALEVVSLESNSITGSGVVAIAQGLKNNTTLRELRLQGQTAAISTEGEEALADTLDTNKTLLKLGLQIRNPTARERIDKALARNNDLKRQQRQAQRASMVVADS